MKLSIDILEPGFWEFVRFQLGELNEIAFLIIILFVGLCVLGIWRIFHGIYCGQQYSIKVKDDNIDSLDRLNRTLQKERNGLESRLAKAVGINEEMQAAAEEADKKGRMIANAFIELTIFNAIQRYVILRISLIENLFTIYSITQNIHQIYTVNRIEDQIKGTPAALDLYERLNQIGGEIADLRVDLRRIGDSNKDELLALNDRILKQNSMLDDLARNLESIYLEMKKPMDIFYGRG